MDSGYLITDGDRVVDCNAAAERVLDALLGGAAPAESVVGARTGVVFDALGMDAGEGEFSVTVGGERRHFEAQSLDLEDDGVVIGDLVVLTDVSERVTARRELARERAEFDALFQGLADPVVKTRIDDRGNPIVGRVNRAFEETFGYDEDDLRGENLDEYIVPPDRDVEAEHITREAADGSVIRQEVLREADGEARRFLLRTAAAGDDTVYAFYTDITDQRRRQRELERQNERLEEFASVVSHDLRNPINVARGYLVAARESEDPGPHIDDVETSLDRIEAIVGDVLALARQGDDVSHPDRVRLSDVARVAWDGVDTGDATLGTEGMEFRADPDRLLQLFENLFRNAVEHGGEDVTVTVAPLPDGEGFYVADDGPGIPEGRREDVLEHGYTTAETGTGFGLTIVARIAEAHGWTVDVAESEAGGARFEFRFDGPSGSGVDWPVLESGEGSGPDGVTGSDGS
ncbi:hypothetical protein BRD00_06120 [Halobacteriales archaeon QS_8_69_26]|nr:MAG: hypothetical protein BRD00_06120 [Halobacteriales archaeon QS_8_69_26]